MKTTDESNAQQLLFGRIFPIAGAVGVVAVATANVLAIHKYLKPGAVFFSHGWWGTWLPLYVIWAALLVTGLTFLRRQKAGDDRA